MKHLSLTEENYLKAIYHLAQASNSDVSTNSIAEELDTKPASVSDMIRKLSDKGVLDYQKYKGVQMTASGIRIALDVIRKHRLWEVFLVEKLGFTWDEVHEVAEQLEHIKSPMLINRLDDFLGNPKMDPHGDPIPDANGKITEFPQRALSNLSVGDHAVVIKVPDSDPSLLRHLDQINISLGSKIRVADKVDYDQSVLISINEAPEIYVSGAIAENIMLAVK